MANGGSGNKVFSSSCACVCEFVCVVCVYACMCVSNVCIRVTEGVLQKHPGFIKAGHLQSGKGKKQVSTYCCKRSSWDKKVPQIVLNYLPPRWTISVTKTVIIAILPDLYRKPYLPTQSCLPSRTPPCRSSSFPTTAGDEE